MSTNSMIAYYDNIGDNVIATYCHYDGYPEYNGKMLVQHYNTSHDALTVAMMGYLSALEADLVQSVLKSANCEAPMEYNSVEEFLAEMSDAPHIEYVYLWIDGGWKVLSLSHAVAPIA